MSQNKQTVQTFLDAFSKSDIAVILSCLTDDIEWSIPGVTHVTGKPAFIEQIQPDSIIGNPTIEVSRMTEERNVVVAEGSIRLASKDGSFRNTLFCDVFVMQDTQIKHLTAYLMELKDETPK
jgi:ketosteroid isomerase-like protein